MKPLATIIILSLFTSIACFGVEKSATQRFFDLGDTLHEVKLEYYLDGGTLCLSLTDVDGDFSAVCLDRSVSEIDLVQEFQDLSPEQIEGIESQSQQCLVVGAIHPSEEGAERIPFRGDIEIWILQRIRIMIEKNPRFKDDLSAFLTACTETDRHIKVRYGHKEPNK